MAERDGEQLYAMLGRIAASLSEIDFEISFGLERLISLDYEAIGGVVIANLPLAAKVKMFANLLPLRAPANTTLVDEFRKIRKLLLDDEDSVAKIRNSVLHGSWLIGHTEDGDLIFECRSRKWRYWRPRQSSAQQQTWSSTQVTKWTIGELGFEVKRSEAAGQRISEFMGEIDNTKLFDIGHGNSTIGLDLLDDDTE